MLVTHASLSNISYVSIARFSVLVWQCVEKCDTQSAIDHTLARLQI
uniref:Uncharacterized protein n=1 Tax=Anguilla anguilla TaxID=7936 RepID=A0A0E9QUZ6_ANGAN